MAEISNRQFVKQDHTKYLRPVDPAVHQLAQDTINFRLSRSYIDTARYDPEKHGGMGEVKTVPDHVKDEGSWLTDYAKRMPPKPKPAGKK